MGEKGLFKKDLRYQKGVPRHSKRAELGGVKCFYSKLEFNKEYKRFRSVDYFEFPGTLEEFERFVERCGKRIILKPIFGSSGAGIYVPSISNNEDVKKLYAKHSGEGVYFAEQMFIQHGALSEINPTSVNTVRMYTVWDGQEVHIMNTFVRFGAPGAFVDNIHGGGMCCEVDMACGMIIASGRDLENHRFVRHRATDRIVVGTQVPQWEKVVETVKEAAMLHTEIGYSAWDLAVSDDEITIIEANDQGNFDLPQCALQRGIKREYEKVLEIRRKNMAKA